MRCSALTESSHDRRMAVIWRTFICLTAYIDVDRHAANLEDWHSDSSESPAVRGLDKDWLYRLRKKSILDAKTLKGSLISKDLWYR